MSGTHKVKEWNLGSEVLKLVRKRDSKVNGRGRKKKFE